MVSFGLHQELCMPWDIIVVVSKWAIIGPGLKAPELIFLVVLLT